MKKQIPWSSIFTTAIPLLAIIALIALLIIVSSGSDITYDNPEIITPIDFTPSVNLADEDVLVAENDSFSLWANLATTKITLYQKDKTGHQKNNLYKYIVNAADKNLTKHTGYH